MKLLRSPAFYLTVLLVLLSCLTEETEARRRVLRGRRTVTRTYYAGPALPGWAIIVVVAIVELVIGVALYFIMRKAVLSSSSSTANTYTPAMTNDV